MKTTIGIDGEDFLINGQKTYAGVTHQGRRIEGLLMNSRMIQAIFDDDNPATRGNWAYPDTRVWSPQRNVDDFCRALPLYRQNGLLAVTVGLQGGGSIYTPGIYDQYLNTAFRPDGSIKSAYLQRLRQVIEAADACGMIVIVNYFYWRQERFQDNASIRRATEAMTQWLIASGYTNILIDVKNEMTEGEGLLCSQGMSQLLDIIRQTTHHGRRIPVGVSTTPWRPPVSGGWQKLVDFFMPHGNDSFPDAWRKELIELKESEHLKSHLRPICCNEDSIDLASMEVCLDLHCSWGYYDQGYGCGQTQKKHDWNLHGREQQQDLLSGYQTLPVNWGINTDHKRAFFDRLREVTTGDATSNSTSTEPATAPEATVTDPPAPAPSCEPIAEETCSTPQATAAAAAEPPDISEPASEASPATASVEPERAAALAETPAAECCEAAAVTAAAPVPASEPATTACADDQA